MPNLDCICTVLFFLLLFEDICVDPGMKGIRSPQSRVKATVASHRAPAGRHHSQRLNCCSADVNLEMKLTVHICMHGRRRRRSAALCIHISIGDPILNSEDEQVKIARTKLCPIPGPRFDVLCSIVLCAKQSLRCPC